jgi:hypothetical protein
MRLDTPEIIWHGDGTKERITSIDFHPFHYTFVTGGSESIDSFKETGNPIFIKVLFFKTNYSKNLRIYSIVLKNKNSSSLNFFI